MTDLDAMYTREWYEADYGPAEVRREWRIIAGGIDRWAHSRFEGATALDVGCGPGLLVSALRERGWEARGFDGSANALRFAEDHVQGVRPHIWQCDVADFNASPDEPTDLVICTEVAEHLDASLAPMLVEKLTLSAFEAIIFTAAAPLQGGHHHVNEQPREYWLDLFAEHGWIEDVESTRDLRARWAKVKRCWWIPKNLMVLH